jgi:hypothetical protein
VILFSLPMWLRMPARHVVSFGWTGMLLVQLRVYAIVAGGRAGVSLLAGLHACLHFLPACVRACVLACLRACVLACLRACVLVSLLSSLPASLLARLLARSALPLCGRILRSPLLSGALSCKEECAGGRV